jgi:murein L,D-transpeptidase YcbB/YkuD
VSPPSQNPQRGALPAPALPRRRLLTVGSLGLAATLAACATAEEEALERLARRPVLAPEPPPEREPLPPAEPASDLAALRDGADPIVAGQRLDGTLLRRFYARHDFEQVWDGHASKAEELQAAVLRAADHGLNPERFGAALLPRLAQLSRPERELLLTHAVLTYAEALAHGAVPPGRRKDAEALAPDPVDVTTTLDTALDSRDPVAVIEGLAPGNAGYLALRLALRRLRGEGRPGRVTTERLRALEVNLERHRWVPRHLPADRIWVNIADQSLVFYRDQRPVFTTRVVVGSETEARQSPEFHTVIDAAYLNPPWRIPEDIVRTAIIPRLERDPDYLTRRNITLRPDGEAEQAPGPESGLGAILFDMPNRFDVYLHDTPDRSIFARENRRLSNGCIRVQNPLELASLVMEKPLETLHEEVATGETQRQDIHRPMPVFLVYQTAVMTPGREVAFREDFYGRDAGVWRGLQARR